MILHRQKVLLSLIYHADRAVSDVELTKWAFLIRHEHESRGGSAFYEFVPYLYGPFSFSLNQEAGKLTDKGLLTYATENSWISLTPPCVKTGSWGRYFFVKRIDLDPTKQQQRA
jgi:hypothetical protein